MQNSPIAMRWKVSTQREKSLLIKTTKKTIRRQRSFLFVAQFPDWPTAIENILHCSCHCDDNCLVGRLSTTERYSISFSRSKALLALAVCLAGCDQISGNFSKILIIQFHNPIRTALAFGLNQHKNWKKTLEKLKKGKVFVKRKLKWWKLVATGESICNTQFKFKQQRLFGSFQVLVWTVHFIQLWPGKTVNKTFETPTSHIFHGFVSANTANAASEDK